MKIKNIKNLVFVVILLLIFSCLSTISLAASSISDVTTEDGEISYWPNGNIEYIKIPEGEIWFFENGDVEDFSLDIDGTGLSEILIEFYEDTHTLEYLEVTCGDISIDENGKMSIDGYANQIIAEAQTIIQNFTKGVENYFNKINIDIDGVNSPKDDLAKLSATLNNMLTFSNTGANQSTNNSGNSSNENNGTSNIQGDLGSLELSVGNQVNLNTNQNGGSLSVGDDVNIDVNQNGGSLSVGNNVNIDMNQNGGSLSVGNDVSINANSNGLDMNFGGVNISVGNNIGVTQDKDGNPIIDLGELDFNIGENGSLSIGVGGAEAEENKVITIVKYVLLGLLFLVAFVILVFGVISIKKKNNQVSVKNSNQNQPNNQVTLNDDNQNTTNNQ